MNNLNLKERTCRKGNTAKQERKKGFVPGVIYGKMKNNILFEISELELNKEISSCGEHGVLDYNFGGVSHNGLIKAIQRDPVTHKIMHIDIEEFDSDEKIETDVPIQFIGEDYLNSKGQVLQKEKDSVRVKCNVDELPKSIKFEVGRGVPGTVYRFADLEVAPEIAIVDDLDMVLASISVERRVIADEMASELKGEIIDDSKKSKEIE